MPHFIYSARSPAGDIRSGEIEMGSRQEVIAHLRRQRLTPLSVRPGSRWKHLRFGRGVTTREVVVFTRQFATMIDAGIPLIQSLSILAEQQTNPQFRRALVHLVDEILAGETLAAAMRRHDRIFGDLYVNMVAAGERGGILDTILNRLAGFLEKNDALMRKVRGAMAYPAVLFAIVLAATMVLLWKVVPIFATIFEGAGVGLPVATQVVLTISTFLQNNIVWLLGAVVAAALASVQAYRSPAGRVVFDRVVLQLPVFGPLARKTAVGRFTRTLGALIGAGVPILDGLEITARTAGNRVIEDAVNRARQSIAGGETISDPLRASGVFPPMVVQMIHVGEQTGGLDTMLGKIADFYDEEVDVAVGALTSVLEPVIILVMGIVVGGMVVAMYLPMFDLVQTVG